MKEYTKELVLLGFVFFCFCGSMALIFRPLLDCPEISPEKGLTESANPAIVEP